MSSSSHTPGRPRGRVATALLAGALCAVAQAPARAADLEYEVKAEFLERFTRFIEWPNLGSEGAFVIGVLGENPFGDYLERLARERTVKGHKVAIRKLTRVDEVGSCHVLFIARDRKGELKEVLARTGGRPILTVGDTPGFAHAGVLINFYLEKGFVRFEINVGAAKASGLKVSPKLLRLGRVVGGAR